MTNKSTLRLAALLGVALLGIASSSAETTSKKALKAADMAASISQGSTTVKDYNSDNRVSVGDVTYFVENSMDVKPGTGDGVAEGPLRAGEAGSTDVAGQLSSKDVKVTLSAAKSFVAFQMDIKVSSSSVTAATAAIASSVKDKSGNTFSFAYFYKAETKTLRVIAYNMSNDTYAGAANADLFTASFTSSADLAASDLAFDNILFVLPEDVTKDVEGSGAITAGGGAKGDVNKDGKVTISDILALIDIMGEKDSSTYDLDAADANGDGKYTVADIIAIINLMK